MANKVIVDADARVIQVKPGYYDLDNRVDLYSDLKEDWLSDPYLSKFVFPFRSVAGDSIGLGQTAPAYFFLRYPWVVRTNGDGMVIRFALNLYGENETGDNVRDVFDIIPGDSVQNETSNIPGFDVITQQAVQFASFENGVTINAITGKAGTEFPLGNRGNPVNNLADAEAIRISRKLRRHYIQGDWTYVNGDSIDGIEAIGENPRETTITLEAGVSTEGCEFSHCTLTGTLDGDTWVSSSHIGALQYIRGQLDSCVLLAEVSVSGPDVIRLLNCKDGTPGGDHSPYLNMNGGTCGVIVSNYTGELEIGNMISSQDIDVGVDAGHVVLRDTISAGNFRLRGIGTLDDYSSGTFVDSHALLSQELVALAVSQSFGDTVYIDPINGTDGTDGTIGIRKNPCKTIENAMIIAPREGIRWLDFVGDLAISGEDISGYKISAQSNFGNSLNISSTITDATIFERMNLSGTVSGGVQICTCAISNLAGVSGLMKGTDLSGTLVIAGLLQATDCSSSGSPGVLDFNNLATAVQWEGKGFYQIDNMPVGAVLYMSNADGQLIVGASCTGGDIYVTGVLSVAPIDLSGGAVTLHDNTLGGVHGYSSWEGSSAEDIADAVWDESSSEHVSTGSFGALVKQVKFWVDALRRLL